VLLCDNCQETVTGAPAGCEDDCAQAPDHSGLCLSRPDAGDACQWCGAEGRLRAAGLADVERALPVAVGSPGAWMLVWPGHLAGPYLSAADAWAAWHSGWLAGATAPGPGGLQTIVVPATDEQAGLFSGLSRRVRDGLLPLASGVLVWERECAMDPRSVGHAGKIAAAAGMVADLQQDAGGLQIVFCDTALHGAPHDEWSVRAELAGRLAGRDFPAAAVRFPGETPWPEGLSSLAAECHAGTVRVLAGATRDLLRVPGIEELVTAVHHLDPPGSAADAAGRASLFQRSRVPASGMTYRYLTAPSTDRARWRAVDAGTDPVAAAVSVITGRPAAPAPRPGKGSRTSSRPPGTRPAGLPAAPPPGRGPR
jgi:hypothetical protein